MVVYGFSGLGDRSITELYVETSCFYVKHLPGFNHFHLLNNETEIKILKLENTSIVFTLIMCINS